MKEWNGDYKTNDVALDVDTNEYVLITNGVCVYDHSSQDAFKEAHKTNGGHCCYQPYEGLVFQTENKTVKGWGMKEITGRRLQKVAPDIDKSIKEQMAEIMEKNRRMEKAKNFKRRK